MASKYIKHAEEESKKYGATVDEQAQAAIDETTTQYDERIAAAEREARELEKQTTDDYISAINAIDLQKALDIKDIQETRANMGLSRSGVSATEQTAAVLAAGNRSNAANLQRQKAIDSLTKSLSDYKIQQGDQLRSDILSINESADKAKADYAANLYEKAYDATAAEEETKRKVNEAALKEKRDSLDSAFKYLSDDEKRQYLPIYMRAIDDGLNGTQFLSRVSAEGARLKNEAELKTLLDEGQIDEETYNAAMKSGDSADKALATYTERQEEKAMLEDKNGPVQQTIDALIKETEEDASLLKKPNQIKLLAQKAVDGEVPSNYIDYICEQLELDPKKAWTAYEEALDEEVQKQLREIKFIRYGASYDGKRPAAENEKDENNHTMNAKEEHILLKKSTPTKFQEAVTTFKTRKMRTGNSPVTTWDIPRAKEVIREYNLNDDQIYSFLKAVGFSDQLIESYKYF